MIKPMKILEFHYRYPMIQLLKILLKVDVACFIGRPRKAGPPPERKMEGSIDVIGGEGSRGTAVFLFSFFFYPYLGTPHSMLGSRNTPIL